MSIGSKFAAGGALVALVGFSAASANAQSLVTFASASAGALTYTDTAVGVAASAITSTTAVGTYSFGTSPVSFTFAVANGLTGNNTNSPVTATLVGFTATAVGQSPASSPGGSVQQNVTNIQGEFETSSGGNLLNFDFGKGVLFFNADGSTQAFFSGSDSVATASSSSNVHDFTSDYLDFNDPNAQGKYYKQQTFSFTISSITNTGAGGGAGPVLDTSNNTVQSFIGSATSSFASNPTPPPMPEPSAVALAVFGGGVSFVPVLRRKRAKKA